MSIRGLITIEKVNLSIRRCDMSERKGSLFEDMVHFAVIFKGILANTYATS